MAIQTKWGTLQQGSAAALCLLGGALPSTKAVMSSVRSVLTTINEINYEVTHPETITALSPIYLRNRLDAWEKEGPATENREHVKKLILEYIKNPTETLTLINLPITSLPEIFSFEPFKSNVKHLDLHGSAIKALPQSISGLIFIEELELSGTQIPSIFDEAPKKPKEPSHFLTDLLPSLPWSALKTTSTVDYKAITPRLDAWEKEGPEKEHRAQAKRLILEYLKDPTSELKLINIPITSLPEIFSFEPFKHSLKILDLHGTHLTSLPESTSELFQLMELNLSNTQITSLPESISKLIFLNFLFLSNTPLKSLPESIGKLENLFELNLANTHITSLPESIKALRKLSVIDTAGSLIKFQAPPSAEESPLSEKLRKLVIEITQAHSSKISQARLAASSVEVIPMDVESSRKRSGEDLLGSAKALKTFEN